jgi:deferrochelatase/peroxidase EfeB
MVLRSGYRQGPLGLTDKGGVVAGFGLVAIHLLFIGIAGWRTAGYSQIDDTISRLGARGAPGEWWFTAVNVIGALLLVAFAIAVQRRLTVGLLTFALLIATAIVAIFVGGFHCSGTCRVGTTDAHGVTASLLGFLIVSFMVAAAYALRHRPRGWFRDLTIALAVADVGFLVTLVAIIEWTDRTHYAGLFERLLWLAGYAWVVAACVSVIRAPRPGYWPDEFDPSLVQRNLLRMRPATNAAYICCAIEDRERAKAWLRALMAGGYVLPDDGSGPSWSVTVAFSAAGLDALGVDVQGGKDLDPFTLGMRARAELLGDGGESDPAYWQPPWSSGRVHVLVWVEAESSGTLGEVIVDLQGLDGSDGLLFLQPFNYASIRSKAHDPPDVEPLRFRDGISQPWLRLRGEHDGERQRFGGALDAFNEWRPLAVGEFVLGEVDESGDVSEVPEPNEVFAHGSFVVVRKLGQDFGALARLTSDMQPKMEARAGGGTASLAVRMVGREVKGDPLEPDDTPDRDNDRDVNDFTYARDPDGLHCTLGAHIRRANPRDALGFGTRLTSRHRIIRRGKVYGKDALAPAPWHYGLMFVGVNARIADQFELIQSLWLNDGDRQRSGTCRDLLAGTSGSESRAILQLEDGPVVTDPVPKLIRTMGGEYFFAPCMAGLRALAR